MSEELILQIEQAKKRHKVTNVKIAQVLGTSPQNVGEKLSTDKRRGASYYELASIIAAIETVSGKKFFAPRFCEVPQSNAQWYDKINISFLMEERKTSGEVAVKRCGPIHYRWNKGRAPVLDSQDSRTRW